MINIKTPIFALIAVSILNLRCGSSEGDDEQELDVLAEQGDPITPSPTPTPTPSPTPKVDTPPPPTPSPTPAPVVDQATIWFASNSYRAIFGYNTAGKKITEIDLSPSLTAGSITAISFYDHNTILVFADPGAAGERIMRINLSGDDVESINNPKSKHTERRRETFHKYEWC